MQNATPKQALKVLSDECIKSDPEHRGISFIGHFTPEDANTKVSVNLEHVSVKEALMQMFPYSVVGSVVYIRYPGDEEFCSRTFSLPNGLYLLGPTAPGEGQKKTYDVLKQLTNAGIRFFPGASATYLSNKKELTVVGTPEEITEVDELLNR